MNSDFKWHLMLQRFGEGGDAGGADSGGNSPDAGDNNEMDFDAFLAQNPKYKGEHERRVKESTDKAIKGRFRKTDAFQQAVNPLLASIASQYGIQAGEDGSYDIQALSDAYNGDASRFEAEAMERGLSVDQVRKEHSDRQELEMYRAQKKARETEENRMALIQRVDRSIQEAAKEFPGVDFMGELNGNPRFRDLVYSGALSAGEAYRALHGKEVEGAAMQYTAQKTREGVAAAVAAGKSRPTEGAAGGAVAQQTAIDPAKLTKAQREEIHKRVRLGERVTF